MISDIGGIIGGIFEVGYGDIQQSKAKHEMAQLRKSRPRYSAYKYKLPSEYEQIVDLAEHRASREYMPGQSRIEQRLQDSTQAGMMGARESSGSTADMIRAATSLYGQEMDIMSDIAIQSAQEKALRERELMGAYAQKAQARMRNQERKAQEYGKSFNWNYAVPYQTRMNELQSQREAGEQMMSSGWSTMGGSASSLGDEIESNVNNPSTNWFGTDINNT